MRHVRTGRAIAAAFIAVLATIVAGCGGGAVNTTPVAATAGGSATQVVPPAGGTLTFSTSTTPNAPTVTLQLAPGSAPGTTVTLKTLTILPQFSDVVTSGLQRTAGRAAQDATCDSSCSFLAYLAGYYADGSPATYVSTNPSAQYFGEEFEVIVFSAPGNILATQVFNPPTALPSNASFVLGMLAETTPLATLIAATGPLQSGGDGFTATLAFAAGAGLPVVAGQAYIITMLANVPAAPTASPTPTASPSPSPTPTTAPTPTGIVSVSPGSLALAGTGAGNALTFRASETNFTGTFTTSGCAGVATASVGATVAGAATITVTGAGTGGSCTLTVGDGLNHSTTENITVSVTTVGGS
jgi:hypothetical protein